MGKRQEVKGKSTKKGKPLKVLHKRPRCIQEGEVERREGRQEGREE